MKLLLGLGNPGEQYQKTRHNVGFMFADYIAEKYDASWKYDKYFQAEIASINSQIILAKPQTFMNRSGESLKQIVIRHGIKPEDVIVAHDDLDIHLGEYKIQMGKGPKKHNGINSIENLWQTVEFWRIRIGVDNRTEQIPGEAYVLSSFEHQELELLNNIFNKIAQDFFHSLLRTGELQKMAFFTIT